MYYQRLSDEAIINGFRGGDAGIIREYFYEWCQAGYRIYDQRYQLSEKENLDFMSLAHQYALYLMEHDWNSITFEDYLRSFDVTSDLRLQFNRMVEDVCDHAPLSRQERMIIIMLLLHGFKGKEIAAELGMTPSAISQKYKRLKEDIIVPYFKKNFDMDLDMPEVMDERAILSREATMEEPSMPAPMSGAMPDMYEPMEYEDMDFSISDIMEQKRLQRHTLTNGQRTTPEFITSLEPNEIFVFGSNLKGMHGGGAAYIAYRKFGAIMGQGVGLQGQSYAIPTMQGGVETIRPYVDEFIQFAKQHPELTFLVTRIGCGIAGFTDDEISPLFAEAHGVENIVLPPNW